MLEPLYVIQRLRLGVSLFTCTGEQGVIGLLETVFANEKLRLLEKFITIVVQAVRIVLRAYRQHHTGYQQRYEEYPFHVSKYNEKS